MIEHSKASILVSHLRSELRRHHLNLREVLIAELIIDCSYGWGLRGIRIPVLDDFTDLSGIDRPNVHRTLQSLEDMQIIHRQELDCMIMYRIQPDSTLWKVRVRVFSATIARANDKLRALNGVTCNETEAADLARCKECPSNFKDCPGAKFFGCDLADSATIAFSKQS